MSVTCALNAAAADAQLAADFDEARTLRAGEQAENGPVQPFAIVHLAPTSAPAMEGTWTS